MLKKLLSVLAVSVIAITISGCTIVLSRSPQRTAVATATSTTASVTFPTSVPTVTPAKVATEPPSVPTPSATPLLLPTATEIATTAPTPTPTEPPVTTYIVVSGDTLSAIASRFGTSVDEIAATNDIADPSKISVGQELIIPNGATHIPSPEPASTLPPTATASVASTGEPATPAPEVTNTPEPSPAAPTPSPPTVSQTTVTLNIIDLQAGLYPLKPEDTGYPYHGIDIGKAGAPAPREFSAYVLENDYLAVTIVPNLGGRIYQIHDKINNQDLLYNNPATIVSTWGMRGWWLAIGGIEWALPTEEHGLVEYLPWAASSEQSENSAAVTVAINEQLTGVNCQIRISLDATHAYVKVQPSLANPGNQEQQLQFWANAMFAPGGRSVSEHTRLVLPFSEVLVHNTSDPGLPPAGTVIPWPQYGPRDLSLLEQWHGFLGVFAYSGGDYGFFGAQVESGPGLLRVQPTSTTKGLKVFGLGDIPYSRYSQVESSYLELWGGLTSSFWQYTAMQPNASVSWDEFWLPLPAMPPITFANSEVALSFTGTGLVLSTTSTSSLIVLAKDSQGRVLQEWRPNVKALEPWQVKAIPAGLSTIEVKDQISGETLVTWPPQRQQ